MTSPLFLPSQPLHVRRFTVYDLHGKPRTFAFGLDPEGVLLCQGPSWWRAGDLPGIVAGWNQLACDAGWRD